MEYIKGVFEFRYKDVNEYKVHSELLQSFGFTLDDDEEFEDGSWIVWYSKSK